MLLGSRPPSVPKAALAKLSDRRVVPDFPARIDEIIEFTSIEPRSNVRIGR